MKLVTEKTISASHFLPEHLGKCKNLHGHNFRIRVMIKGPVKTKVNLENSEEIGMIVDFQRIKAILNKYDHRNLNDMDEFKIAPPTAENLATLLGYEIYALEESFTEVVVQVYESKDSYIEWNNHDDFFSDSSPVAFQVPDTTGSGHPLDIPLDADKLRESNKDLNGDQE